MGSRHFTLLMKIRSLGYASSAYARRRSGYLSVWCLQEMTEKEVEYVSLSRDTTESDLKQRREIASGSAVHIDQVSH